MIYFEQNNELGIPDSEYLYLENVSTINRIREYKKTRLFIMKGLISLQQKKPFLYNGNLSVQFINYGSTELVYVLETKENKFAILVSQPNLPFGIVKKEFENLNHLAIKHPNTIVCPIDYYSDGIRELYIAPYINQARCICPQNEWGLYIPEPSYHFESFTKEERAIVLPSMIATLIKLYDEDIEAGIGDCNIAGNDFMLEKQWSSENKSFENTIKKMKLIAARKLINITFEKYLNLIRQEFCLRTKDNENKLGILLNHRCDVPLKKEEIDKGIQLGLNMRKSSR